MWEEDDQRRSARSRRSNCSDAIGADLNDGIDEDADPEVTVGSAALRMSVTGSPHV